MATTKQARASKRNVKKAQAGAQKKRSIANMPARTRTALGKQGAAVAERKRTGGSSPKTRQELYEEAKQRDIPGRSKMGRSELARALPQKKARRRSGGSSRRMDISELLLEAFDRVRRATHAATEGAPPEHLVARP